VDACLIASFLSLTFLLGVFPLKDADIYWHLRTGDLVRETGHVPHTDIFTFTRQDVPWIDLHWFFEVAISWLFEYGGVVALNVAKCAVTCLAVFFLVTSRRREWPVWVMVAAWLPALFLLGGRIYVRPETLTLLYLSIFLAVIARWDRLPRLVVLLPFVQIAWVNSQGLFVFGPILLIFGMIDAALRFGVFAPERRKWWRTILPASLATCAACLINPYFITGAIFPLELAGTMRNPIFSRQVAELMPIPDFIRSVGYWNLSLQLHLWTIGLGALSFLLPLGWRIWVRVTGDKLVDSGAAEDRTGDASQGASAGGKRRSRAKSSRVKARKSAPSPVAPVDRLPEWTISPFRLALYAAFCILSWQATRNSHQFAAAVGTITAWNFGEWAAAIGRQRARTAGQHGSDLSGLSPRLVTLGALGVLLLWVGSGQFFKMTGEGRTIGLGEEPYFFPHAAARFAGRPEMPARFISFHNGHAALFEYYHGPERKVYTDPRLEVAGADLFARYTELQHRITIDAPGWEAVLNEIGRPVVLVDHENNAALGATLLRSDHWRCVWFDAIAAVFVHDAFASTVKAHTVDFAARHFRPDSSRTGAKDIAGLTAAANAYRKYVLALVGAAPDRAGPLAALGLDDARQIIRQAPESFEGWKNLGQIELHRGPPAVSSPRFRAAFDPVYDLSAVRATYALSRALELEPDDFRTNLELKNAYDRRLMTEAALVVLERMASLHPKNAAQRAMLAQIGPARAEYLRKLGRRLPFTWRNLSELDQIVSAQLAAGRAESAAALLERANPSGSAPWEVVDRIATLRLHLGEPDVARELWETAAPPSQAGIQAARIGTTYLVENDFDAARRHYRQALEADPTLFEAWYCLAVVAQDDGDAVSALDLARKALAVAPDDNARAAARLIISAVGWFARRTSDAKIADRSESLAPAVPRRSP
jgi:tetratricopeptide (TPR) repeat protein